MPLRRFPLLFSRRTFGGELIYKSDFSLSLGDLFSLREDRQTLPRLSRPIRSGLRLSRAGSGSPSCPTGGEGARSGPRALAGFSGPGEGLCPHFSVRFHLGRRGGAGSVSGLRAPRHPQGRAAGARAPGGLGVPAVPRDSRAGPGAGVPARPSPVGRPRCPPRPARSLEKPCRGPGAARRHRGFPRRA